MPTKVNCIFVFVFSLSLANFRPEFNFKTSPPHPDWPTDFPWSAPSLMNKAQSTYLLLYILSKMTLDDMMKLEEELVLLPASEFEDKEKKLNNSGGDLEEEPEDETTTPEETPSVEETTSSEPRDPALTKALLRRLSSAEKQKQVVQKIVEIASSHNQAIPAILVSAKGMNFTRTIKVSCRFADIFPSNFSNYFQRYQRGKRKIERHQVFIRYSTG
jgi:hypothetical protein